MFSKSKGPSCFVLVTVGLTLKDQRLSYIPKPTTEPFPLKKNNGLNKFISLMRFPLFWNTHLRIQMLPIHDSVLSVEDEFARGQQIFSEASCTPDCDLQTKGFKDE